MGSKSNYLENAILNHVLGGQTYTPPATVYVALFTVAPGEAGGGTEVSGGGYSRVAVANNTTNWPTTTSGQKSNANAITFPQATANWGTIVAWGLFDAATGGNLLYYGDVSPSRAVNSGDTAQFAAGALTFTED
jgi:hypothetical protein